MPVGIHSPSHAFTEEVLFSPRAAQGRFDWPGAFHMNQTNEHNPLTVSTRTPSGVAITQQTDGIGLGYSFGD